ncbi:MAG: TonB-dependent receptor [Desulfobacterales bacterium]|nr:TonB-dependent receptor [Desulfobacterales bacterium]
MKYLKLFLICIPLILSRICLAASDAQPVTLPEVVVTATRSATTMDKIGGNSITVITAKDIESKKSRSVAELLKEIPGLDIESQGGPGTQTAVFIRGADSKNTLVLIDGVVFNDPSSPNRSADIGNLNIDNIERIEVVRGAMSVLYGSNATAGVVNIITKKGKSKPSVYGGIEGGSYNTWKVYAGSDGGLDVFNYSFSLSRTETDGFSIANADNDRILHNGNTSEKDGWKNTTLSGKLGYDITPDFDINASVRYMNSEVRVDDWYSGNWPTYDAGYLVDQVDYDPFWTATPNPSGNKRQRWDNEQAYYRVDAHNFFFDRFLESTFYYNGSLHTRDGFDADGTLAYDYDGKTNEFGFQGTMNFQDVNLLHMGASYWKEALESKSSSIDKDADISSFWVQDQLFWGESLDLVAGLRYDIHDRFGGATTYRVAPAYTLATSNTTLKASYGTGFRAPSLFELYSVYGNENLQEEKSKGWDVGVEQPLSDNKIKVGLTYFDTVFDDRIDYDFATSTYNQLPGNTKTKGIEAFIKYAPASTLDLTIHYTYTDTEDPDGNQLVRRPYNKVYANMRYRFLNRGVFNLDYYWVDERREIDSAKDVNGTPVEKLDAYSLVNLAVTYDLYQWLQLYGRIDNLFDAFYESAWSYATPGLSVYVGVKLKTF